MAHFPARPCFGFTVQMQFYVRSGTRFRPVGFAFSPKIAQQVSHGRWRELHYRSKTQTADRSQLLLELARHICVEREMTGIMRSRCQFIHQKLIPCTKKELYAEHSNYFELFQNGARDLNRVSKNRGTHVAGRNGEVENVVAVPVFGYPEMRELAGFRSRRHHRHLALESDKSLKHRLLLPDSFPCLAGLIGAANRELPFAVVAESGRFQHSRQAQLLHRHLQLGDAPDSAKRSYRQARVAKESFLPQPVLCDMKNVAAGTNRSKFGSSGRGGGRDVFKLKRYCGNAAREVADRVQIVIGSCYLPVRHLARRRVLVRRKRMDAVAHSPCCHGKHASELPAAEYADSAAGKDRRAQPFVTHSGIRSSSTACVCLLRNCSNASR